MKAGSPLLISRFYRTGWLPILKFPKVNGSKTFPNFILAGEGEVPKTFRTPGMAPHGIEVTVEFILTLTKSLIRHTSTAMVYARLMHDGIHQVDPQELQR